MSERLCAIRWAGNPAYACERPVGHGGGHAYAPTVDVLKRTEWDGFTTRDKTKVDAKHSWERE